VKKLSWRTQLLRVMPIGLLSSATIVMGNAVYLYLSVAYIQMLKALTPFYILLCCLAFGMEKPSASSYLPS